MNNLKSAFLKITFLNSLKTEVREIREKSSVMGGRYKQNQQLEELRYLQDNLGKEKLQWQLQKEAEEQHLELKKKEMARMQAEVDRERKEVQEQKDQLFRKLDLLKAQGIEIGPNMSVLKTASTVDPNSSSNVTASSQELYYYR